MKIKLLTLLTLLSSLVGYLEWGADQGGLLIQLEMEILVKLANDPLSAAHPMTLLPLFGQVLLLITLVSSRPRKFLVYSGIGSIGILMLFIFIIGIIGPHWLILGSSLPFLLISTLTVKELRKATGKQL
ncbi:hypothetical protein [Marinoscillum sp.]|uniref:hypothetical protein n=1 Tax=Marinoscillum sp. TaxID=2024838 RepID=UPI003BAC1368